MTPRLVKRLALNLLVAPYDLYEMARDWVARFKRHDAQLFGEYPGRLALRPSWQRVAIVASYPNQYSPSFLFNLLDGLAENGFFILVVTEKQLPVELRNTILARCHHLIERFPLGRDFGSYKAGWAWISRRAELKDIDTLALVNDSLYYPRRIAATIYQMLEQKADWLCMYENFQTLYHAQSFFQVFRKPIISSAAFAAFWRGYAPTSARLRTITTGEVGLTRVLLDARFEPQAYYNAVRLRADVLAALESRNIPAVLEDVLNLMLGFETRRETGRPPMQRKEFLALLSVDVAHKAGMLAEKYNPTHAVGLLCNYLYQAPLKRDICYRGIHAMSDIVTLAQGFSPEEKDAMFNDLRRKGVPANFAGIRKIPQRVLWATGRI